MIEELDVVVLTHDLPGHGLLAGDLGTVVDRSADGCSFLVEFVRGDGVTVTVERLAFDELRRMTGEEIAHARQL